MKFDLAILSVIIGLIILLVDIFFPDYLFGLNTPLLIAALGFIVFTFVKRNDKKSN